MGSAESKLATVHQRIGCTACIEIEALAMEGGAMPQQTQPIVPVAVGTDEGEARWWSEGLAVIKATAADTSGQMTILDITEPPNSEAPLHVHHTEDEGFWILEGSATFEIGGESIEAEAGDYLFGPRDIPHRFTTGPHGCRMLFILTPGGFEEVLRAISRPATERTLPPPDGAPPSEDEMKAMQAAIEAHGCEILG